VIGAVLYLADDQELQRQLVVFTKWLVIVGALQGAALFVQAVVLGITLLVIRRQANIMAEHAKSLDALASFGRENTGAAKSNAEAARANAEAAQKSIALLIQKERARISVETVGGLEPVTFGNGFLAKIKITSYGINNAIIKDTGIDFARYSRLDYPKSEAFLPIVELPNILPPKIEGMEISTSTLFSTLGELPPSVADDIRQEKTVIVLYGFIKYRDVLMATEEPDRETMFCYLWKVTDLPVPFGAAEPYSLWQKIGPPEVNHET